MTGMSYLQKKKKGPGYPGATAGPRPSGRHMAAGLAAHHPGTPAPPAGVARHGCPAARLPGCGCALPVLAQRSAQGAGRRAQAQQNTWEARRKKAQNHTLFPLCSVTSHLRPSNSIGWCFPLIPGILSNNALSSRNMFRIRKENWKMHEMKKWNKMVNITVWNAWGKKKHLDSLSNNPSRQLIQCANCILMPLHHIKNANCIFMHFQHI